jgi:hypothetical protein
MTDKIDIDGAAARVTPGEEAVILRADVIPDALFDPMFESELAHWE